MNCANHSDRLATAFCQNCGKALCPLCARHHAGLVLCEPCLLQRESAEAAAASAVPGSASGFTSGTAAGAGWTPVMPAPGAPTAWNASGGSASPVLAGLLGFIPGVGAMYNGQFIKALLHVVIFIVLIGITTHFPLGGLLIAAWIFYQVFEAAQTAGARRDGRPLPDPFGILDMSQRLGPQGAPPIHPAAPYAPAAAAPHFAVPPQGAPGATEAPRQAGAAAPPWDQPWQNAAPGYAQGFVQSPGAQWTAPPYTPAYAPVAPPPPQRHGEPVGAIVLIVVGLLFLLSTLGWLDVNWIGRGWPVLVLLLGVWLLLRRVNTPPVTGYVPPAAPAAPPRPGGSLQIYPLEKTPEQDRSGQEPSGHEHAEQNRPEQSHPEQSHREDDRS